MTAPLYLLNQDYQELRGLLAVLLLLFCQGNRESLEGQSHLCLLELCLDQVGPVVLDDPGNLERIGVISEQINIYTLVGKSEQKRCIHHIVHQVQGGQGLLEDLEHLTQQSHQEVQGDLGIPEVQKDLTQDENRHDLDGTI